MSYENDNMSCHELPHISVAVTSGVMPSSYQFFFKILQNVR